MYKKYQKEAMELTQNILFEYWQGNLEPLIEHLHEHILWIGSMDEEYIHSADAMIKRLEENVNEMPPVFMDTEEYSVIQSEGNTCVVVGRYRAFTKPESGLLLSENQRVTFVWEKQKRDGAEVLKLKHLHLSNALHIQSEDERFPTKAGRDNYEYMKRIMAERSLDQVITVKDDNKVNRVINYSDIMYIRAENNYFRISMANERNNIRVRGKLSAFLVELPDNFISVNRSFAVNKSYVKEINGQELIMMDGESCHMSATVRAKVNRQLQYMHKTN